MGVGDRERRIELVTVISEDGTWYMLSADMVASLEHVTVSRVRTGS